MLPTKYQIFISSTFTDLIEPRARVRDAILSMNHFPVGMEMFGAANEEQWEIIKETIDSSDYYVLIVGQRYGTVIADGKDAGISYTEREFRYALEQKIPVLVFIIDDDVPVKPDNMERDNPDKLKDFKSFVCTGRTVDWWKNSDELAQKVTASLYKQITRTRRPGWIRGDTIDVEKSLKMITELSERNQALTDENIVLRQEIQALKQKPVRRPKLAVELLAEPPEENEEDAHLYKRQDTFIIDDAGKLHLKVCTTCAESIRTQYLPVNRADFTEILQGYITEEDVKKYNDTLPDQESVDIYVEAYEKFHLLQDGGVVVTAAVSNSGNAKATDVTVTIEFPEEIGVFDIDNIKDMKEPTAPRLPRDLEEIAYERMYGEQNIIENLSFHLGFSPQSGIELADISSLMSRDSYYESWEIMDNTLYIEVKNGIVHTKTDYSEGVYLVPKEKGEFKAKVTLMCAEYEEPEEKELVFVCE